MKRILLCGAIFFTSISIVNSQTPTKWSYDFGTTNVATYTGAIVTSGTSFPSTQTINTYNGGSLALAGPGTAGGVGIVTSGGIGTGGRLKLNVPSASDANGSTNKFSIYDIDPTATTRQGALKFQTSFEGGGGDVLVSIGNGSVFNAAGNLSTSQSMALVRFNLNELASDVTVQLFAKTANNWLTALPTTYAKGTLHTVEVYYNNLNTVGTYKKSGADQSLAINTFDLWIDNTLVADNAEISGTMSINVNNDASKIDSYMFTNRTVSNAAGVWYVDNVAYTNYLPMDESVLPVTFSQLSAKSSGDKVQVNWATASEANNDRFEIEASTDGKTFKTVKTVKSKNGNSTAVQEYQEEISLTDVAGVLALPLLLGFIGFGPASRRRKIAVGLATVGLLATNFVACQKEGNDLLSQKQQDSAAITNGQKTIYIRIKQVDKNGEFSYSDVVVAK